MPAHTEVEQGGVVDFNSLVARMTAKERAKIEKHLAAADADAGGARGKLFRSVGTVLGQLATGGMESVGNTAWRFFIPDGKYRMQVFALEDPGDGTLRVFLQDVLADAEKAKILTKTKEPGAYQVKGSRIPLRLETLDSTNTPEPPAHVKHMLGWNRRALRLTLIAADADTPQAAAAASLCTLAAGKWPKSSAAGK
jgi:hypothetical protein